MIRITLYELMHSKRINGKRLHDLTGIAESTISSINTGKSTRISIETIDKICKALNCQPGDFMKYEED